MNKEEAELFWNKLRQLRKLQKQMRGPSRTASRASDDSAKDLHIDLLSEQSDEVPLPEATENDLQLASAEPSGTTTASAVSALRMIKEIEASVKSMKEGMMAEPKHAFMGRQKKERRSEYR
mmetsp:Transcript_32839/g.51206  ORF Transcript_32839/g.51206 Transcript_32839/m.51206 type:complete len:121 (-) Transcript_32839:2256-2618(-)